MAEEREQNDLQQILTEDDAVGNKFSEVTPPISPGVSKVTQTSPTSPETNNNKDIGSSIGGCSLRGGISQGSSSSKSLCRIATAPTITSNPASNCSGNCQCLQLCPNYTSAGMALSCNLSRIKDCLIHPNFLDKCTRFTFLNEKIRPARPAHPPPPNRMKRDVTDVRRMETALLSLLEDFHSGNLRAFGKDCSMEQMTGIREQQERLAKLHFELGASQTLYAPLSDEGLTQGKQNMAALMSSLEQLSESIEKLHSFSSQHD